MKQEGVSHNVALPFTFLKKYLKGQKRRIMETQIIFSPCKKIYLIFKKNPLKTNQNH
jgi:hypothetical protein